MVDGEVLSALHRKTVWQCLGISCVPFLFVAIALLMASDGPLGEDIPDDSLLWIFGVMALLPLAFVSLQHFVLAPRAVMRAEQDVELVIAAQALAEYAVWMLSPMIGFLLVVFTGRWEWLLGTLGLCLLGAILSFPRLSVWTRLADMHHGQLTGSEPMFPR